MAATAGALSVKDFTTDQEVRWCPGCGDYAILKAVRKVLAKVGTPTHRVAFVSGIGCAARFPYYVACYGFHTIHGRAPAVATGLKLANPELDVWVVGGDGDFLSIGANHTLHALRRNVELNLLLFNNATYGLTKGQYSPTSAVGTESPSSPGGSIDPPLNAAAFALGVGARFVARSVDSLQDHLPVVLEAAHAHPGAALVEIYQNCIVFNDAVFAGLEDKKSARENAVMLEHGQPMVFGSNADRGLELDPASGEMRVIELTGDAERARVAVHDVRNAAQAMALARMQAPLLPVALGVLYDDPAPAYVKTLTHGRDRLTPPGDREALAGLLGAGETWTVGGEAA